MHAALHSRLPPHNAGSHPTRRAAPLLSVPFVRAHRYINQRQTQTAEVRGQRSRRRQAHRTERGLCKPAPLGGKMETGTPSRLQPVRCSRRLTLPYRRATHRRPLAQEAQPPPTQGARLPRGPHRHPPPAFRPASLPPDPTLPLTDSWSGGGSASETARKGRMEGGREAAEEGRREETARWGRPNPDAHPGSPARKRRQDRGPVWEVPARSPRPRLRSMPPQGWVSGP